MRWNVTDLNALLTLRCVFLEQSWETYWELCAQLAANCYASTVDVKLD